MMLFVYSIIIRLYYICVKLAAFSNKKARDFIDGRKNFSSPKKRTNTSESCIWFHCASLGEFEQARPLIEWLTENKEHKKILVTFYSPSGYIIRKNYSHADYVCYLPLEIPHQIHTFLNQYNPEIAIFIRYEIWPVLLSNLNKRKIPTYLIAAGFRESHWYFQFYGKWLLPYLKNFQTIYHANEPSFNLAIQQGLLNSKRSGDPRFDRVLSISHQANPPMSLLKAYKNVKTLIAGSTWAADMDIILSFPSKFQDWKWIVVPHNIDPETIQSHLSKMPQKTLRWSDFKAADVLPEHQCMLIDEVGMLATLYSLSDIAYIGGGFGTSVHNVAEAAVYGIPVIFGPHHTKSAEALDLLTMKAALSIHNEAEFSAAISYFAKEENKNRARTIASKYIAQNAGATEKICIDLFEKNK